MIARVPIPRAAARMAGFWKIPQLTSQIRSAEHEQAAPERQHPLDAPGVQEGLEHPPQDNRFLVPHLGHRQRIDELRHVNGWLIRLPRSERVRLWRRACRKGRLRADRGEPQRSAAPGTVDAFADEIPRRLPYCVHTGIAPKSSW